MQIFIYIRKVYGEIMAGGEEGSVEPVNWLVGSLVVYDTRLDDEDNYPSFLIFSSSSFFVASSPLVSRAPLPPMVSNKFLCSQFSM